MLKLSGVEIVLLGPLPAWEDDTAINQDINALPVTNNPSDCDVVIQVCQPRGVRKFSVPSVLYTFLDVSGPTVEQEAILRNLPLVVAPNTSIQSAYQAKGLNTCLFQPNIDTKIFKPQPRWRIEGDRALSFIFVGTHSFRKGTDLLIDGFCDTFKRQEAHLHMHIPGTSPDGLHNHITHSSVKRRRAYNITISSNYMSMPWLSRYYARADCYVTPTRGEGWGIPVMEAMACGLPVMTPLAGGLKDFVDPNSMFKIEGKSRPVTEISTIFGSHFSKQYTDDNALEYYEPDYKSVIQQFKAVAKLSRAELGERGEAGRQHLLKEFSPKRGRDQAEAVLDAIRNAIG